MSGGMQEQRTTGAIQRTQRGPDFRMYPSPITTLFTHRRQRGPGRRTPPPAAAHPAPCPSVSGRTPCSAAKPLRGHSQSPSPSSMQRGSEVAGVRVPWQAVGICRSGHQQSTLTSRGDLPVGASAEYPDKQPRGIKPITCVEHQSILDLKDGRKVRAPLPYQE